MHHVPPTYIHLHASVSVRACHDALNAALFDSIWGHQTLVLEEPYYCFSTDWQAYAVQLDTAQNHSSDTVHKCIPLLIIDLIWEVSVPNRHEQGQTHLCRG